jgi:predicted glycoside hydrolase/deacetylase ChbG (UPF0249 family)
MQLEVIVNGDDLGASAEINRAIFHLMAQDKLTSASILANGPDVEAAMEGTRRFPQCSFGVHLNVTEFEPLHPTEGLRALMNERGHFGKVIPGVHLTRRLLQAISLEWAAQIERLLSAGLRPTHIDSHHHVHNLPHLLPALRELRRKYAIPRSRITMNVFGPGERKPASLLLKKKLYNFALRRVCGFETTDAFTAFQTFYALGLRPRPGIRTIELMTHPGHPSYEDETRLLGDGWEKQSPCSIRLINYADRSLAGGI